MTELITTELKEVDDNRAKQIRKWFEPMLNTLDAIEEEYAAVLAMPMSKEASSEARGLRLRISKIRTDAEKEKTKRKKAYLVAGNAIQAVFNLVKHAVVDKEDKLKDIENYYENQEKARLAALSMARLKVLSEYTNVDPGIDLAEMNEKAWELYRNATKENYKTRIEAEERAEADRLAAEENEKALRAAERAENLRLKNEANIAAAELEKTERELKEAQEKLDKQKTIFETIESTETVKDELSELLGFGPAEPAFPEETVNIAEQSIKMEVIERSEKVILLDTVEYLKTVKKELKSDQANNAFTKAINTIAGTAMML